MYTNSAETKYYLGAITLVLNGLTSCTLFLFFFHFVFQILKIIPFFPQFKSHMQYKNFFYITWLIKRYRLNPHFDSDRRPVNTKLNVFSSKRIEFTLYNSNRCFSVSALANALMVFTIIPHWKLQYWYIRFSSVSSILTRIFKYWNNVECHKKNKCSL